MKFCLTTKILGLACIMVALILALGTASFWSGRDLVAKADDANKRLSDALEATATAFWAIKQYQNQADLIINQDLKTVESFEESAKKFEAHFKKVQEMADTPEEKQWVATMIKADEKFDQVFKQGIVPEVKYVKQRVLQGLDHEADTLIGQVEEFASKITASLEQEFQGAVKLGDQEAIIKRANDVLAAQKMVHWSVKQYQIMADTIINRSLEEAKEFDQAAVQMDKYRDAAGKAIDTPQEKEWFAKLVVADEGFDKLYRQKVLPAVKREIENRIVKLDGESDQALLVVEAMVNKLVTSLQSEADQASTDYQNTSSFVQTLTVILGAGAVVVGLVLGFLLARGIAGLIRKVVDALDSASDQMASASSEVSSSGQSLAQGSSEQAASIEETSASLEELSSMTKQNADNAQKADELMRDASVVVASANQSMDNLKQSIDRITNASEETGKIIKTIDEIVFQTNLLALNAAVEAAKNTAELIEGNIKNIKEGSDLVHVTDEAFGRVQESTQKVGELVGEIAGASQEQSQGIHQINDSTTTMDKITQQVAANAEEAAAASEELSAQSVELKAMVARLASVVEGGNGSAHKARELAHQEVELLPEP